MNKKVGNKWEVWPEEKARGVQETRMKLNDFYDREVGKPTGL